MFTPDLIADRLEIEQLLTVYAAAVDARDWERFREVFTNDVVLDYSAFGGPRAS